MKISNTPICRKSADNPNAEGFVRLDGGFSDRGAGFPTLLKSIPLQPLQTPHFTHRADSLAGSQRAIEVLPVRRREACTSRQAGSPDSAPILGDEFLILHSSPKNLSGCKWITPLGGPTPRRTGPNAATNNFADRTIKPPRLPGRRCGCARRSRSSASRSCRHDYRPS
jgi:hypothetical protein